MSKIDKALKIKRRLKALQLQEEFYEICLENMKNEQMLTKKCLTELSERVMTEEEVKNVLKKYHQPLLKSGDE